MWLAFKGGAPNYYPNSFSAPEQQPRYALESSSHVSGDVRRYNTANDDNVSQVTAASSATEWPVPPLNNVSNRSPVTFREDISNHKPVPLLGGVGELLLCSPGTRDASFQFSQMLLKGYGAAHWGRSDSMEI